MASSNRIPDSSGLVSQGVSEANEDWIKRGWGVIRPDGTEVDTLAEVAGHGETPVETAMRMLSPALAARAPAKLLAEAREVIRPGLPENLGEQVYRDGADESQYETEDTPVETDGTAERKRPGSPPDSDLVDPGVQRDGHQSG